MDSKMKNMAVDLRNIISAINNLHENGYVSINHISFSNIINDFYPVFYYDIYEHRNPSRLNDFYAIFSKSSSKEITTFQKYLIMTFPVKIENGIIKMKKNNRNIASQKKRFTNRFEKMKDRFSPDNFIDFTTFKIIYDEFEDVNINQIDSLIELFGSIDHLKKQLKKTLKWPSTDIAISIRSIFKTGWISSGLLSSEGYHVGNIGLDFESRKIVLKDIIFKEFTEDDDFMDDDYINTWSSPGTLPRLLKLARTIAALCRNAKRSSHDYTNAINDWESDLTYLKTEFYEPWIQKEAIGQAIEQLKWPETAV